MKMKVDFLCDIYNEGTPSLSDDNIRTILRQTRIPEEELLRFMLMELHEIKNILREKD